MAILGVIPARYASTRFPGKPLIDIQGKSMIQRVYEQVCKSKLVDRVVIATDDSRIHSHVKEFGAAVEMTGSHHVSGTDRVAEVAMRHSNAHIVLNIQGDEPFIDPNQIDQLASILQKQREFSIATLVKRLEEVKAIFDPNVVKAVFDKKGRALYFSRSTVPHVRGQSASNWDPKNVVYKHIGLYGFRRNTLLEIGKLGAGRLELAESLEQLRWLENGYSIGVAITELESISVDHPSDLELLKKYF